MLLPNKYKGSYKLPKISDKGEAYKYHLTLREQKVFQESPLHDHTAFAKLLGVKKVLIKEEGKRIELKSFKILGVSYALHKYLQKNSKTLNEEVTFCATTDGNHGRALSFMCNRIKKKCIIFVPFDTSDERVNAIKKYNAKVVKTDMDYDKTMAYCEKQAQENGWINVSDFSVGEEDSEIPTWIMRGYSGLFSETEAQIAKMDDNVKLSHVFTQAGVGCFAGSGGYFFHGKSDKPTIVCTEPSSADCYFQSAKNEGKLTQSPGKCDSIMNGLNCGIPSYASFKWVLNEYDFFMTIQSDDLVKEKMRYLYNEEPKIVAGESAVAGLVGLHECVKNKEWKKKIGLDENSVVLCVLTEGDTDPGIFKSIIEEKKK